MDTKRKMKLRTKLGIVFFVFILVVSVVFGFYCYKENKFLKLEMFLTKQKEEREMKEREEQEKLQKEKDYNACLVRSFSDNEMSEELVLMKSNIDNYIVNNHYNVSVKYEDMKTGFTYAYKENQVYYGASLIKLVDAVYLINKAIAGEVNLDTETVTYTVNYKKAYSSGMASHSYGDKVTLRELIRHAITVSDNSAHLMLMDYIGFNKLKSYGQGIGGQFILSGGDKFGNQSAHDTNLYLKEAYKIINENEEYGPFLKEIMGNEVRNSYNKEGIKIYHKYGSYDVYYHDIGLNLDIENPYAISILTTHEKSNYQEVVQGVHEKVIELHNTFYENRKKACQLEIYGS